MSGGEHAPHPVPPLANRGRIAVTREELDAWGERFGHAAHPPLIVTLAGELGAGKTTLAQAICRGYGVQDAVTSPTFALVHRYASARGPVFHLDLYRLRGPEELTNIGWDEIIDERALVLIEWPERAVGRVPDHHVPIDLEYLPGDEQRRVLLAG